MVGRKRAMALAVALAVVCAAGAAWVAQSRDAWFVKSIVDRVVPWSAPMTLYAETPAADGYFHSYDDAAGAYENYVYELTAYDADGGQRRVVLVSFGTMLDESKPYIQMVAKGSSVRAWEYGEAPDIVFPPQAAGA